LSIFCSRGTPPRAVEPTNPTLSVSDNPAVWRCACGRPPATRHIRTSSFPRTPQLNRSTSLKRNTPLLGPYSRTMPRVLWRSWGGGAVSYERGTPVTRERSLRRVCAGVAYVFLSLSLYLSVSLSLSLSRSLSLSVSMSLSVSFSLSLCYAAAWWMAPSDDSGR